MPAPLAGLAAGIVKGGAMLGRGAMAVGRVGARGAGALARNTARGGAQNFITGKKKTSCKCILFILINIIEMRDEVWRKDFICKSSFIKRLEILSSSDKFNTTTFAPSTL